MQNKAVLVKGEGGTFRYNEGDEQIKISPRHIPFVADKIKEGFIEDGWQDAGSASVKNGVSMSFLDFDRKFIAVISLIKSQKGVACSYKVEKFTSELIQSVGEDKNGNPVLAIGGIAAITATAIAFPMVSLGAAIIGLGTALFSSSTKDEVTAKAIEIIRRKLTDIEEEIVLRRKIPRAKKYDIFISYRNDQGREYGRMLYEFYTKKGKKVFFYQYASERISKVINDATRNAVRNSRHILVVLTPGFFDKCVEKDDGCRVEIETAINENKSIIPIRLAGYSGKNIPADLPAELSDFAQWQGVSIPNLAPDVSAVSAIARRMRLNCKTKRVRKSWQERKSGL